MKHFLALLLMLCCLPAIAPAEETVVLHVDETTYMTAEYQLDAFYAQYPHIRVEPAPDSANAAETDILAGADVDVFNVAADSAYDSIVSKGYALALDNSDLLARGGRLIPALQEICFREGQLYALPSQLTLNHWTLDETAWLNVGFTLDEIPATLSDFLARYQDWQDRSGDFADTYFCENCTPEYLIRVLTRQYIASHESKDAPVVFDDSFRAALKMISDARPLFDADRERMEALQFGDDSAWPLIYAYSMDYGYTSLDGHDARPLMIPALAAGTKPFSEGEAFLYFVSARTQHPAEAQIFLNFLMEQQSADTAYMIYADRTEPVESAWYLEQQPKNAAELMEINQKLESCADADRPALEERKAWLENWLDPENGIRWAIAPRDIAVHAAVAANVRIPMDSLCLAQGSNCYQTLLSLIARFADSSMTDADIDHFVEEMNNACSLAFREQ